METAYPRITFRSGDFKWIVYIILMAFVWIGIASDFYQHIPNDIIKWMNRIYRLFNNKIWLNIPICLTILYHFIKLYYKIVFINDIRIHWFFLIAFVYLILYYQVPFDYAIIIWGIDYRLFLSVLLGIVLLGMLYVFFDYFRSDNWISEDFINEHIKGFSPDYKFPSVYKKEERLYLSLPIEAYVNVIVQKLKKTKLKKTDLGFDYDSFAIGITSEWGTGKTTFLRRLKEEIWWENISRDIVDFNPWMCQSAEQVTKDFFSTLRNSLSQRHPALSDPIKKYAKQLRAITLPVFGSISFELDFNISDKSLLETKQQLSGEFSKLEKPVVVIIDDLDRLDSREVFEVLRLIRNTADLSNMIYLVAYDKNYITKILENQHISDPTAYLEKIFQLEIQLPLVSDDSVWHTLWGNLRQQLPEDTDISFIEDQKDLIKEILNSYRRAKRFARLYSLDIDYLNKESFNDLNRKEKFLLDLLQMDDKDIYDILWGQPEKLLRKDEKIWKYRKEELKERMEGDIIILKDGTQIKPTTNKLLDCLWPESNVEIDLNSNSIRCVENYEEYFTMKIQFTKRNINQIIESKLEDVDALIEQFTGKMPLPSIIFDFMIDYNNSNNLEEKQKKNLIWGALSVSYYCYDDDYVHDIADERIRKIATKENGLLVMDWFKKKFEGKECNYESLLTLLQDVEKEEVINHENVETIIQLLIQHFVDNNNCSILDIIQFKGIVSSLCWGLVHLNANNRKIASNHLIDIYSKKGQKPTMEEYEKVRDNIMNNEGYNRFKMVFEDDWQDYLVMIQNKCIEPKKLSDNS